MSLPRLLLVDDSQAILAYETATLSDHYAIVAAKSGREAMDRLGEGTFAAVLLDLSMPEMDGDEVLRAIKADARLARVPVIIVSTERDRAQACLEGGAAAFLPKPIRADELRAVVDRVLRDARRLAETSQVAVLPLVLGHLRFAVSLEQVKHVVLAPYAKRLGASEGSPLVFDFHSEWVAILDLAGAVGVNHIAAPVERQVVILNAQAPAAPYADAHCLFGIAVDEIAAPDRLRRAPTDVPHDPRPFAPEAVVAHVFSEPDEIPVVDPLRLFSSRLLASLPGAIRLAEAATAPAMQP